MTDNILIKRKRSEDRAYSDFELTICKLFAEKTIIEYIQREYNCEDIVIVSPDAGGVKRYGI